MEIARVRVAGIDQVRAVVRDTVTDHDFLYPLSSCRPSIRALYPACSPTGFPPTVSASRGSMLRICRSLSISCYLPTNAILTRENKHSRDSGTGESHEGPDCAGADIF
jgi:hypothetical protein